ncbi:hypothetical protein ACHAXT_008878 [Thalassiosira profunda]
MDDLLSSAGLRGGGEAAISALKHLVDSGKISLDDVQSAVHAAACPADSTKRDASCSGGIKKGKAKAARPRSTEKYRTRHVALQFSYDGTDFSGFAENVGKESDASVERALFAALEKTRLLVAPEDNGMMMVNEEKKDGEGTGKQSARTASQYSRCGRTDRGVHAHGQVVALYLKSAFPLSARKMGSSFSMEGGELLTEECLPKNSLDGLECLVRLRRKLADGRSPLVQKTLTELDYPRMLNNVLPPSIRVLGWCPVSAQFSARFSCSRRTYRYFFPRRNLDLSLVARGLQYMTGRHDFRNLCKMNCEQVYNFERVVMSGKVVTPQLVYEASMGEGEQPASTFSVRDGSSRDAPPSSRDMCHVEIVGQAFLWHQIRCIMSVLFLVGRGLEPPEIVKELFDIESNPAKPSYEMASETALVLQDCTFARLELGRTVRNLWDVTKTLEQRWEAHAVAAERARDALASVKGETEVRWADVKEFVEQIARERRKKEQKRTKMMAGDDGEVARALEERAPETAMISWGSAVQIIEEVLGIHPHLPNGAGESKRGQTESSIHVPLMERAKGTTYEEKVQSILGNGKEGDDDGKSSRKRERYEENIINKRKTKEEDKAFYEHMSRQGGSHIS